MPQNLDTQWYKLEHGKGETATQLSRRDFLKLSIPATGLLVLGGVPISETALAESYRTLSPNTAAMLYEASKCIGCRRCEDACRSWNKLPPEYRPLDLSARSWTVVKFRQIEENGTVKWLPSKWQCMHCIHPTCVTVCPTGALYKTKEGPVLYDESRCIGCQYCVTACPFSVPRFDWERERMVKKCTMCADRIANGLEPACVEVCPVQALTFGERQAVIAKAEEAQAKGAYIYGKEEVGGTSWIYTSGVPFDERGFPTVATESYPSHSGAIWGSQIGTIVVGAAALGVYSLYLRRKKIEGEQR